MNAARLLIDSAPATLFGMIALWAAVSQRHWFVRTAIVAGMVLVTLLIPAFEIVILLGLQSLLVACGMAIWRRRRRSASASAADVSPERARFHVSLETLMLVVVIVAVGTAFVARVPPSVVGDLYWLMTNAAVTAGVCLTCVWIVFGRAPVVTRLLALPFLAVFWGLSHVSVNWAGHIVRYWYRAIGQPLTDYILIALRDYSGHLYWLTIHGFSMAVLCGWLALMRRTGWFDPFDEPTPVSSMDTADQRKTTMWRMAAVALLGLVAIVPLALLNRLLTPPHIPNLTGSRPGRFDRLVVAGRLIGESDEQVQFRLRQLTDAQLRERITGSEAGLKLVRQAIEHSCNFPVIGATGPNAMTVDERRALFGICDAIFARILLASRTGTARQQIDANLDLLPLAMFETNGIGVDRYQFNGIFWPFEEGAVANIWQCQPALAPDECRQLLEQLSTLDRQRAPWERRVALEHTIASNLYWKKRVEVVLNEWSGADPYVYEHYNHCLNQIRMRMLITSLAIRAFELENDRPPAKFAELIPSYLPAIPTDPYGNGDALKYVASGDEFLLYSVGPNRIDEGGKSPPKGTQLEGDVTSLDQFPLPTKQPAPVTSTPNGGASNDGTNN
jgi:hypothetical protein